MTTFTPAIDGYLYEGKTVEFSDLWTRDGLLLVLLDGEWGVQTLGYEDFQKEEFGLVAGFHPDFFGMVCIEEQAENEDFNWYLSCFDRGDACEYVDGDGNECLKPAPWTSIVQNETTFEEHFCGTHTAETLRDATIYRVIAA